MTSTTRLPMDRSARGAWCDAYYLTAKEVKERVPLRKLMELDGHRFTETGEYAKCKCPFHKEKTPSFCIYPNKIDARCFGCGWKGDVFNYVMDRDKHDKFREAFNTIINTPQAFTPSIPVSNSVREIKKLTLEQRKIIETAPARLINEEWLRNRVAAPRKWKSDTIRLLAEQGYLGWHRGALAFIYPDGLKLRDWPNKEFTWEFGHQGLWRGNRIKGATHVYVTEGETDAISLIDAGMETSGAVVVCVPGASAFKEEWASRFTGKTVTLCFDNDEAGQKAMVKVANLLRPYAAALQTVNLGEAA